MKYLVLFLFISNSIFSQNNAIAPKSGAIVFVKEEMIYDKALYTKSIKDLLPKIKKEMMNQIYLERLTDGKKLDTITLKSEVNKMAQNFEMMLPFLLEEQNEIIKFYNEFNKDIITKYYTVNGELIKNKIIINQTTLEVKDEYDEFVEIEKNEIIKLTEYKNDIREINGFNVLRLFIAIMSRK
jgi:ubiquinone biosynthesis protein COQ9